MIVLCIFEFSLWAKADKMPKQKLAEDVGRLSIFEIIVGLANTPTLVCGIIQLINAGKFKGHRPD